jgi:hypothetical protein
MKFSVLQEQGSIQGTFDNDAASDVISGRNGLCKILGRLMKWKLYYHPN